MVAVLRRRKFICSGVTALYPAALVIIDHFYRCSLKTLVFVYSSNFKRLFHPYTLMVHWVPNSPPFYMVCRNIHFSTDSPTTNQVFFVYRLRPWGMLMMELFFEKIACLSFIVLLKTETYYRYTFETPVFIHF